MDAKIYRLRRWRASATDVVSENVDRVSAPNDVNESADAEKSVFLQLQPVKVVDVELWVALEKAQRSHVGDTLSGFDKFARCSNDHAIGAITVFDAPALRFATAAIGRTLVTIVAQKSGNAHHSVDVLGFLSSLAFIVVTAATNFIGRLPDVDRLVRGCELPIRTRCDLQAGVVSAELGCWNEMRCPARTQNQGIRQP